MLRGDRLLRLALRNLVCLGGDEGDEFDAAVDEEVAGVAGEGDGGFRRGGGGGCGEDFRDYLLDGRCKEEEGAGVSEVSGRREDGSCDWRRLLELRGYAHLLVRRDRRCLCICEPLRVYRGDVGLTSELSVRHTGRGIRLE